MCSVPGAPTVGVVRPGRGCWGSRQLRLSSVETATPQAEVIRLIGHLPFIYVTYRAREKKIRVVPGREYSGLVYNLMSPIRMRMCPMISHISH